MNATAHTSAPATAAAATPAAVPASATAARPDAAVASSPRRATLGVVLVLASGVCFGLSALFAKGAYAGGASVTGMLIWRFLIAASILWVVVSLRRPALPAPRVVLTAIGLGALGYALQAGLYFGAIARLDAGLAALLLYVYPAVVTLIGIGLRRESPSVRKGVALACSAVGLALLLGLGGLGSATPTGVAFALGAALTYSVYTVVAATIPQEADVLFVAAIIITSALASLLTATFLTAARLTLGPPSAVWLWVSAFAVVGTVVALAFHQPDSDGWVRRQPRSCRVWSRSLRPSRSPSSRASG